MTETRFTRGPWGLGERRGQEIDIDTGPEPSLGYSDWAGMATVFGSDDNPFEGEDVMLANANLIAAAPDLYVEMARYLPLIERAEADPVIWAYLTSGSGIATANGYREALAKATGSTT